ncbi:hypothetical protein GDO86_002729 [Hymenochirus boettgeri]|uniref:Bromo domain-containing protein n=1 Tax=Hymenochirus boettgeri TaxID=247094 RepID=A0A8T2K1H6_9PIPI|nr:hypothetical protein GDO86_002729 [Hymenochirus boettgeri]
MFLATGNSDHAIRLYYFGSETPQKITELEGHKDLIDSVQFANRGQRFVSGSNDGTARIWYLEQRDWKSIVLDMKETCKQSSKCDDDDEQYTRPKVLMIAWDLSDSIVITASSLRSLKVWESHTGKLLRILLGHQNDIYVLEPHPFDPRVVLSAGYDGKIIIWDVTKGTQIKCFCNTIELEGHGSILDCKLSANGQHIASTDSHGHLLIFGFGCSKPYEKIPNELFFHTDYRPLCVDGNQFVLDEQTQLAPHLLPPPFLVDVDGNPHEPKYQRLVPGRENYEDKHLVPQLGYMETSEGEIVEQVIDQQVNNDAQIPEPSSQEGTRPSLTANTQRELGLVLNAVDRLIVLVRPEQFDPSQTAELDYLALRRRMYLPEMDPSKYRQQERFRIANGEEEKTAHEKIHFKPELPCQESERLSEGRSLRNCKKTKCHSSPPRYDIELFFELSCEEGEESESRGSDEEVSSVTSSSSTTCIDKESDWSSEESSQYSDWTVDARIDLQPPSRASSRHRSKKKVTNSEDESSTEEQLAPPKNKVRKISSLERQNLERIPLDPENVNSFLPPLWITDTTPKRSPFVPQMGDDVIYFRQGHEAYINAVRRNNLSIVKRLKEPWKHTILRDQELVKIVGIHYEVGPPTLCCLKLALIDHVTGIFSDQSFSLKYHDMPDVIDFLVLRQFYDLSCQTDWRPGDRFRSIIDDAWWFGTVLCQEPFQADYPDSLYQCYTVKWDNTEIERLSPWDMEVIPAYVSPPSEMGTSVSISSDELEELLYTPQKGDWGDGHQDPECERIICGIDRILNLEIATAFAAPVDLNTYPLYCLAVPYPTDLSTIRMRLINRFYRRRAALIWEVRCIELNAAAFNEENSPIIKAAKKVTALLLKFIMDSKSTNIGDLSSDEESAREQQKKSAAKGKTDIWKKQCLDLINHVLECEDSEPFREPVDLGEYSDYLDVVETPIDFGTIKEALDEGQYSSPVDLHKHMRLVFSNAKLYTPDKKSKIYNMAVRLSSFVDLKMDRIISDYKAALSLSKNRGRDANNSKRNHKHRVLISETDTESEQEPCSLQSTSSELFSINSQDSIASTSGRASHRDLTDGATTVPVKRSRATAIKSSSSSSSAAESETDDSSSSTSYSQCSSSSEDDDSIRTSVSNSSGSKGLMKRRASIPNQGRTANAKQASQGDYRWKSPSSKRRISSDSDESGPSGKECRTSGAPKKILRKSAALAVNKIKCMSDFEGSTSSSDTDCSAAKSIRTLPQRAAATEAKKRLLDGSGEENSVKSHSEQEAGMEQCAKNPNSRSSSCDRFRSIIDDACGLVWNSFVPGAVPGRLSDSLYQCYTVK